MLQEQPLADWKVYLRWRVLADAAPYLSAAFEEESFHFNGTVLSGVPAMEPRWQRTARVLRRADRPGRRPALRRPLFSARGAGAPRGDGRQHRGGGEGPSGAGRLDERTHPRQGAGQIRPFPRHDRLSAQVARLHRARRSGATATSRTSAAPARSRRAASSAASGRRSTATSSRTCRRRWSTPTSSPTPTRSCSWPPSSSRRSSTPRWTTRSTTAASAWSSATRSRTASTTGAASTTPTATSPTGGPRRTPRSSRPARRKLVDEFSHFEALPGLPINGELTLSENIADLGGLAVAYDALRAFARRPAAAAEDRRLHARAALLPRLWPALAHQVPRRRAAAAGDEQ